MPAQIQTADSKHNVQNANSGSWTLVYPDNLVSGDLILALMGIDGSRSVTFPTGFTANVLDVPGSAQMHAVAHKISDGTETGNFTVSLNGNERGGWAVLRITGWHGTTVPEITNSDHATNANPDPPSISPSWGAEDTLFIATFAADNGGWTMDAVPTGYTSGGAQISSFGGGDAGMGYAYRSALVATENPGTFTISTATNNHVARTVAIRPAAVSGPVDKSASDVANLALTESPAILSLLTLADTLNLTLAELGALVVTLGVTDLLDLATDDGSPVLDVLLERSDDLSLAFDEQRSIFGALTVSDSLDLALAEAAGVVVNVAASDTLDLLLAEASTVSAVLALADTLGLSIDEAAALFVRITPVDDLDITVEDIAALFVTVAVADALDLSVVDALQLVVAIGATDALAVGVGEVSNVVDLDLTERRLAYRRIVTQPGLRFRAIETYPGLSFTAIRTGANV